MADKSLSEKELKDDIADKKEPKEKDSDKEGPKAKDSDKDKPDNDSDDTTDKKTSAKGSIKIALIIAGVVAAIGVLFIYMWYVAVILALGLLIYWAVKYPKARWWIIIGVLIITVGYFVNMWVGGIAMFVYIVLLWYKVPQARWVIVILLIIALVAVGAYLVVATGRGKSIWSELAFLKDNELAAAQSLGKSQWNYFWDCKIMSVEGCEIAALKGDTGGVFMTRLEARPLEIEENVHPVRIEGSMTGKSWTSKLGGKDREGPGVDDLDIQVSTKWDDDVLNEKYPNNWHCLPEPIGANDEFNCRHPLVSLNEFKNTKTVVCGAPLKKVAAEEVGVLACGVETTAVYTYTSEGFRMFKFTEDSDLVNWGDLVKDDVWWSAKAPVVLTIDQRTWDKAQEPWDSYASPEPVDFVIDVVVSNNIPTDLSDIFAGLNIEDMSAKLGKLKLELPSRQGILVDCGIGEKSYQENEFIYCEYDFEGKEIAGAEQTSYLLSLYFEDYSPGIVDDYTINGDIDYTSEISRTTKVKIKYRGTEKDADSDEDPWEQVG